MSVLNPNSDDEPQECPLCMEYLELDDINFYPCSCGYQICRFCWNKIRTEGSGLCPACRSPYAENPADFKPLTAEELAKIKEEKRKKDQAKKQKISENRKHLANVRVVQRNLVFVVGLSPRLADQDVLRKAEYFGKFGRIHKVVINQNTSYAGNQSQGPSASAYVTYFRSEDALRAIQAVNNIFIDNRTLKASLGTTKYCSHFMKNQSCPKHDCMYLHELGDEAASFTKEEMQQGKHTEYEKNLHEELMAATAAAEIAESAENAAPTTNGTLGHAAPTGKEPKTSRTPSPKAAGSAGVGWPNLSSSSTSTTPTNISGGGGGGGSGRVGGSNINNNFRSDPPEREPTPNQLSNHRRDSASAPLHHLFGNHLGHTIGSQSASTTPTAASGPCPDSPESNRSAARSPNNHDLNDEPEQVVVNNCDSNQWSNLLSNDDLFGEDDLGFDPFHETQKALAEMIESESKQHFEALQMLGGGGGISNGAIPPSSSSGSSTINRPKQPPPGFSLLNLTGMHQPAVPNLLSHDLHNLAGGLDNFSNSGHHLPPINHFNDFASNGYGRPQQQQQPHSNHHGHHPFVTSPTENHLGPQLRQHQQQQQQHSHHLLDKTSKDWQEGLRALLPNVNVSFGALPNQSDGLHTPPAANGRMFSSPPLNDHHHHNHHDRLPQRQHSGWNTMSPNDWTVLDPAIVGGQLADPSSSNRSDSPSNWIKANLEQLTSETYNPSSLLSGFSGINLGGQHHQQQAQQHSGGLNNWGGQGGLLANTPPPGFSFNRGMAGMGNTPLQHPFQNLSGLGNSNDGPGQQLENEFRGLIRS